MEQEKRNYNYRRLSLFCRKFGVLLREGVPIKTTLDLLGKEFPYFHEITQSGWEDIKSHVMLNPAFFDNIDSLHPLIPRVIYQSEENGRIDDCLIGLANLFEKKYKLQKKKDSFKETRGKIIFYSTLSLLSEFEIPIKQQLFLTAQDSLYPSAETLFDLQFKISDDYHPPLRNQNISNELNDEGLEQVIENMDGQEESFDLEKISELLLIKGKKTYESDLSNLLSLHPCFSLFEINMVRAGEIGGLNEAFLQIAKYFEKEYDLMSS